MKKRINKNDLFNIAEEIKNNGQHLALTIHTPSNKEVIVVPNDDIENKINYIDKSYDSDLNHKSLLSGGVEITDVCNLQEWIEKVKKHGFKGTADGYRKIIDAIEEERENQ